METLTATTDEFQRVKEALKHTREEELKHIEALLAEIAEAKRTITEDSSMTNNALAAILRLTQDANKQVIDSHKAQQNALTKYGRILEKKYKLDLDSIADTAALNGTEHAILEAVCLHFLIHGEFELADSLIKESNIDVPISTLDNYARLFDILTPLRQNNLAPALSWAAQHRDLFSKEQENNLEFALHRLQYLQLLISGDVYTALMYARAYIGPFCRKQLEDVPRLMGALLYAGRLQDSPYADMVNDNQWNEVEQLFRTEYCKALKLPSESPLHTSIMVGTIAIPSIIKMSQVMKSNRTEWTQQDELPVSIPIPDSVRYHSIFVCPVSKDYGTNENPPMRLPCGHVICRESLMKLSNHDQTRFKCPYCPSEATTSQAKRIYF